MTIIQMQIKSDPSAGGVGLPASHCRPLLLPVAQFSLFLKAGNHIRSASIPGFSIQAVHPKGENDDHCGLESHGVSDLSRDISSVDEHLRIPARISCFALHDIRK
jgi:hypothetical protein